LKIGIIGAGISGLTAARFLHKEHEITLISGESRIGGHTNTIPVADPSGPIMVDTGFIVFNRRNYPMFTRLLEEIGVSSKPTNMSFSVSHIPDNIEYGGANWRTLFSQPENVFRPAYLRMLTDIRKFMSLRDIVLETDASTSVSEFCKEHRLSKEFLEWFLMPLGAALWSCPVGTLPSFPIRFVGDFMASHGMMQMKDRPQWEVINGGSNTYLGPLVKPFESQILTGDPVVKIERNNNGARVTQKSGKTTVFNHVIVACHADDAASLIFEPDNEEMDMFSAFPYQKNKVTLHYDEALLPKRKSAWSSWNYRVSDLNQKSATCTYNMNILQSLNTQRTYCVTLNEDHRIDPKKIIKSFDYAHPTATDAGMRMKIRRNEFINRRGLSYCGAYWGFGFHEDGVRSAYEVSTALATRRP